MKTPTPQKILFGRYRLENLVAFLEIDFSVIAVNEKMSALQSVIAVNEKMSALQTEMLRVARYLWPPRGKPLKLIERANWRREANKVQDELRKDLRRVVSTTPSPDHDKFVLRLIDKLVRTNKNGVYETIYETNPQRKVTSLKNHISIKTDCDRLILFSKGKFLVARAKFPMLEIFSKDGGELISGGKVYSLDWCPGDSLWDSVYFQLARAIEERCLEDLKTCRQCNKLFVRKKSNQESCVASCRTVSNNTRRLTKKDERGRNYFQKNRDDKREANLKTARQLVKEGKPISRIVEKTGLSQRVLRKECVIP